METFCTCMLLTCQSIWLLLKTRGPFITATSISLSFRLFRIHVDYKAEECPFLACTVPLGTLMSPLTIPAPLTKTFPPYMLNRNGCSKSVLKVASLETSGAGLFPRGMTWYLMFSDFSSSYSSGDKRSKASFEGARRINFSLSENKLKLLISSRYLVNLVDIKLFYYFFEVIFVLFQYFS